MFGLKWLDTALPRLVQKEGQKLLLNRLLGSEGDTVGHSLVKVGTEGGTEADAE